ncbi:KTSC domain-containing protein [Acinetobacter guillouiae]|uniref:KTSC domain-containing protein n=1 Tax=Acinetobacter guillouiae TaxID=106649 RepID=UPI002FD94182
MKIIEINSKNIKRVLYQRYSLTVELMNGERFLYQLVSENAFNDFLNAEDKDEFYKTFIKGNSKFPRFQLFV